MSTEIKKEKKWTIIMQISAENNLFDDMLNVMQELYNIKTADNSIDEFDDVNFIVIFDGLRAEKFSTDFARPSIYEVKPNSSFLLDFPNPEINGHRIKEDLSNTNTLTAVYEYIRHYYPAKQFGFICKGHGGPGVGDIGSGQFYEKIFKVPADVAGDEDKIKDLISKKIKGWTFEGAYEIKGYIPCNDDNRYVMVILSRNNNKALTYRKLSEVLYDVFKREKRAFLFLDCCWGMQIESAYTFMNNCEYFIASADEMPAAGIGYDDFLAKIICRPRIIGREIANMLLSVYFTNKYDDYDVDIEEFRHMGVSLTNLKTDALREFINKFNTLCEYLCREMDQLGILILKARKCCRDYTYVVPDEYAVFNIDMIWFFENLRYFNDKLCINDEELSGMLLEIIYILTVKLRYGYLGNNYDDALLGTEALGGKGITITFPETRDLFDISFYSSEESVRPRFVNDTGWNNVLLSYYEYTKKNAKEPAKFIEYYHNKFNKGNTHLLSIFNIEDINNEDSPGRISSLFTDYPRVTTESKWGKFVPINGQSGT
ncbi:MAG: clostripain-related cysteine peptidase [Ferruginibacter sp.]